MASVLLIAPSVHHRIAFREQDKEHIVLVGNGLAIGGLAFLAVAMVGVVFLITDFLFGTTATTAVTGVTTVAFAVIWFVVPVRRKFAAR
jgi:hypothetical protein